MNNEERKKHFSEMAEQFRKDDEEKAKKEDDRLNKTAENLDSKFTLAFSLIQKDIIKKIFFYYFFALLPLLIF